MSKYFVLTESVGLDRIHQTIEENEIQWIPCELDPPFTGQGIILAEEDFCEICKILGFEQNSFRLLETDQNDVFVVEFGLAISDDDPHAKLKVDYAKLVMGRLSQDAAALQQKIASCEAQIEKSSQDIFNVSRELFEERIKVHHIRQYGLEVTNKLIKDFEDLQDSTEILSITINDGVMTVMTAPIIVKVNGAEISLGSYRIDISPLQAQPLFSATSDKQIRRIDGENFIHPLIPASGKVRLDRLLPTFAQLIGEWNFAQVIQLCVNLLKNLDQANSQRALNWRQ